MKKALFIATTTLIFSNHTVIANPMDNMHETMHSGHWQAPKDAQMIQNPIEKSEKSIAFGKSLFETNCSACHGVQGKGDGPAAAALNPKPADLTMMAPMHSDGDLAWKISNGRGFMPKWHGILSEDEIWHIVNYLKTFGTQSAKHHVHNHEQGENHDHES